MNKTKKQALEAIKDALKAVTSDIKASSDQSANLTRAETVKRLAEAYERVSRG